MYCRATSVGRSTPAKAVIISMRSSASRVSLAWTVLIEPSWPVFMACSISSTSPPRAFSLAFDVGGTHFQRDDVGLLKLQFGSLLDGDDSFVRRDEAADVVEH